MKTRMKQPQSLALAVILALGVGVLWSAAAYVCIALIEYVTSSSGESGFSMSDEVAILRDGTRVVFTTEFVDKETGLVNKTRDGKIVNLANIQKKSARSSSLGSDIEVNYDFPGLKWKDRLIMAHHGITTTHQPTKRPEENWYFLHDGRLNGVGYFVGYDSATNRRIGYIGLNGFRRNEPPQAEQFPVNGQRMEYHDAVAFQLSYSEQSFFIGGVPDFDFSAAVPELPSHEEYVLTDNGLMRVDFAARSTAFVRKDPTIVSAALGLINARTPPQHVDEAATDKAALFVRTPDRILLLNLNGKEMQAYHLPKELRNEPVTWFQLAGNAAVARVENFD